MAAALGVLVGALLFLVARGFADGSCSRASACSRATSGPRRCSACWSCSACRRPRSSCRSRRSGGSSPSRSASSATRARAVRAGCGGGSCCRSIGLAVLLPTTAKHEDGVPTLLLAVGIIALLVGVAVLLPWLVERTVARLGAGAVAWQLAVRRLQLDPGGAARACQRDRGRGRGGDRAADGVLRRAGALPGGDAGEPGPRAARALPRRAAVPAQASPPGSGGRRRALGDRGAPSTATRSTSARARRCASWRRSATARPATRSPPSPQRPPARPSSPSARTRAARTRRRVHHARAARPTDRDLRVRPRRPAAYEAVRNAAADLDPLIAVSRSSGSPPTPSSRCSAARCSRARRS